MLDNGLMRLQAGPATGVEAMTLAIFHVLKGQRDVEELLRAIPDARLIPGDACSGGSRRVARTLLGLLVIVIAGLSAGCRDSSTASGAPLPPVVKVERVLEKDVPIYGEWVGTTVGYVTAQISARVSGYLVSQTYKEGARVKAGDPLFEIDPRPYQIAAEQARAQLEQAESQLEQAKAQIAQAEADVARAVANQKKTELDVGRYTCAFHLFVRSAHAARRRYS